MAMTTDFTGSYDYEADEAREEFANLIADRGDYTDDELQARVEHIKKHWRKVLDTEYGFRDFMLAWNTCCNDEKLSLGFYIID